MTQLTIVTAVHPSHREIVKRAIESVRSQSVPCKHLVGMDNELRGAGAIRNALLQQVKTDYVTFLDADDRLEPDFAERCLQAADTAHYIYTDWYEGERIQEAPNHAWCAGEWHLITSVLPTEVAQLVLFDTSLPALEDTDFWLRVMQAGVCGRRIPKPLVHYDYNPTGRSQQARKSGVEEQIKHELRLRHGGKPMACCGESVINTAPVGARLEGDVLAMALWHGNREEKGRVTHRLYPRISYPRTAWLDPRDIDAARHLWKRMETAVLHPEYEPQKGVQILDPSDLLPTTGLTGTSVPLAEPGQGAPDAKRVMKVAKKRL